MHFPPQSGEPPAIAAAPFLFVRHRIRFLPGCRWIIVVDCLQLQTLQSDRWRANIRRLTEETTHRKVCAAGETMTKPASGTPSPETTRRKLRSSEWFNDPQNPGMTALYL